MKPIVGLIANPVSARDIRRVVANATSLQIADRANIVLRVLAALAASGVENVLMMPEKSGIRGYVMRGIERSRVQEDLCFPHVTYLDMPVSGTVEDTVSAARLMHRAGVAAIIILGGDGTHRAVVKECGEIPLAGISTGTNNAFPEPGEPTITGLATGLVVMGQVPADRAFRRNKRLDLRIGDATDVALVDIALVTDRYIGARALWRSETFRELFVTFANPEAIGMAAIAGLIEPVGREEPGGMMVSLCPAARAKTVLHAPIAPGLIVPIGIEDWRRMPAGVAFSPQLAAGSIALDGEREIFFSEQDQISIMLSADAFRTIDVRAVMHFAATHGLMRIAATQLTIAMA